MLEMPLSTVMMSDGAPFRGQPDDLGREAVAELEAIGHQEIHRRESPGAQAAHDERGAGRAIRIEVPDDEDASLAMLEDQFDGRIDAVERAYRHESVERERELAAVAHTARRVSAPQHRMQREIGDFAAARRATFDDQFHGSAIMPIGSGVPSRFEPVDGGGARISIAAARPDPKRRSFATRSKLRKCHRLPSADFMGANQFASSASSGFREVRRSCAANSTTTCGATHDIEYVAETAPERQLSATPASERAQSWRSTDRANEVHARPLAAEAFDAFTGRSASTRAPHNHSAGYACFPARPRAL